MDTIRRLILDEKENRISFPGVTVPLTMIEAELLEGDLYKMVLAPYNARLTHLEGLFQRVIDASRTGSNAQIRGVLGETIIDQIIGTWGAARFLTERLGIIIPSMADVQMIVNGFINALGELYQQDNPELLHLAARRYEEKHNLPRLPGPVGRKKKSINTYTATFGRKLNDLFEAGFTLQQAVGEIIKEISAKSLSVRTSDERKFFDNLRGRDSTAQRKAANNLIRHWQNAGMP